MPDELVFLGLGSNLGDCQALLSQALLEIEALGVENFRISNFYDTTPVSPIPQPNFLNCACAFETGLSPEALLQALQEIEARLGKRPKKKNEPRPIDIDILLFGERFIDTPALQVPHPALLERLFVLRPLCDLAETLRVPQREGPPLQIHLREFLRTFANSHQEIVNCHQ